MKSVIRIAMAGFTLTAAALLAGCEVYDEPSPYGPVVYDNYYWGGYYDGPYWVYRDRDGRWYHEGRGDHDRHEHDEYGYRGGDGFQHAREGSRAGGHSEAHAGGGGGHGGGGGSEGHGGGGGGGGGGHGR